VRRSLTIVPKTKSRDIYLVLDDCGEFGRIWRETHEADTERGRLIQDLLAGQYYDPICIVAFNVSDGWSRDVTDDIADELRDRCVDLDQTPVYLQEFLKLHPNGGRT
jgi:hypothetical protein